MARRNPLPSRPPGGYALLTTAASLGADLRAALRVLMYLPDNRGDVTAWLRERASHADRAVGVYLEMSGREMWSDHDLHREVVELLDKHHPELNKRVVCTPLLVLHSEEGYWAGWGFSTDRRCARVYDDVSDCLRDFRELQEQGMSAIPKFRQSEERWCGEDTMRPIDLDPWGKALEMKRKVPGCAWIPIPPALREQLEGELLLECWVRKEPGAFKEMLRAAARFGHPIYTVYADLSARQLWDPAFREELARIDLLNARYRDPPGEIPVLQPMVGPYRVLYGPAGFWNGARWTSRLEEAEQFPQLNRDFDEKYEEARLRAEELTGVSVVKLTVPEHPATCSATKKS